MLRSSCGSFTRARGRGKPARLARNEITARAPKPLDTMTHSLTTSPNAWRWLGATSPIERGENDAYYDRVRTELLDMIEVAPRNVLDIGCGGGATDAELKRRYPTAIVTGIEPVGEAAEQARKNLDCVIHANAETLDFDTAGIADASVDLIIVADVLEHMYDPWRLLKRVRSLLAPGGQILASIPNIRNLWMLEKIVDGYFDYRDEGLLDITHIRFFTFREMLALFDNTGYNVERTRFNIDGNLPERVPLSRVSGPGSFAIFLHELRTWFNRNHRHVLVSRERGRTFRIDTARLRLRNLTKTDLDELFSSQIYIIASRSELTTTLEATPPAD